MDAEITVQEGVDISQRAEDFGFNSPTRFSFVPYGIDEADSMDELAISDEVLTVRKLLKQEGIDETPLDENVDLNTYSQKGADIFIGTLHITYPFLVNHWTDVITVIQIIQHYYSKRRNAEEVRMTINTTKENGDSIDVEYEGPVDGLEGALEKAKEIVDDD